MSGENIEVIRRAAARTNAGEWDALAELWHPDAEWRDLQHPPDLPERVHGLQAIREVFSHWAVLDIAAEIYEFIDADPWVICDVGWRVTARGGGQAVETRLADTYEVREGLIVRAVMSYPDTATALGAVRGLSEKPVG